MKTIGSNVQDTAPSHEAGRTAARVAERLTLAGFVLYAVFAPHAISGAWGGLIIAASGWLLRLALTGARAGLRRTRLDLPLWLLFAWTVGSALLSEEPRVSLAKLLNAATFVVFYLWRGALTRRTAVLVAALLVASASAGSLWSVAETALGRGFVVAEVEADSPFHGQTLRGTDTLEAGDAVWRAAGRRVSSAAELDEAIRRTPTGGRLALSVIKRGEHVEWPGIVVTDEMKARASPSGLRGDSPTRRFRASGWTRHYETFAEVLQIIAQLALGFALAAAGRGRPRAVVALACAAVVVLGAGLALTAMRTALVAFAAGASVLVLRASAGTSRRARLLVMAAVVCALTLGVLAVGRTRAGGALLLRDESARLRFEVARVALERVPLHPFFGHGMDAVQRHWQEWGFPGTDMLHTHSTPVQIAFERGLPALAFWLWLMLALWRTASRAEKVWRGSDSALPHGLALGTTGAVAGFAASSLVNYNFGDSEVTLLLWFLMGALVKLEGRRQKAESRRQSGRA